MASAEAGRPIATGISQLPDSFWRSLRYFSIYRLIVAGVFFFAATFYGSTVSLGALDLRMFRWVGASYLAAAIGFLGVVNFVRRAFSVQLTAQVAADIFALTLLMYASGGAKSGVGVMIFVVLAGAGLVGQGRMALFYAALATLALLIEQSSHFIHLDEDEWGFFRTGITSIGFFGTAVVARLLGRRVISNEALARQRGTELANQMQINQRVIRDMLDGVLVVGADRRVRQHNPQAELLLGTRPAAGADLAAYCPALADQFDRWSAHPVETETLIRATDGRSLRARLLPPGEGDSALIYLEDLGRIQAQAQQIKLAALGRLTANMAHEIRNPLSAISQASELLIDEPSGAGQSRLVRIIGDNTQRLNRLVDEVLELGRRDRAQPEAIRIGAYLHQFVDELAMNDADLRACISISADPQISLSFDRSHLHRVLWNLVGNALRHCSGAPGSVRVSALGTGRAGVELHIVDDGPGIDESLRGQVFEPFFTTYGSGTGLGLYIARELCEANGAQIDLLENSPGAHFRIVAKRET